MSMTPWWALPVRSPELASAIWKRVKLLRTRRRGENLRDLIHEAIYRGRPLGAAGDSVTLASMVTQRSAPATINIVKAKVDAIASRMSKHRPFPVISAEDAGWTERRFARRVSSVLRTRIGQTSLERDRTMRQRDAIVRGTGIAEVARTENNGVVDVGVERVPRSEILYAPREARYGSPRSIHRVRSFPLEVLLARFPGAKTKRALEMAATRASPEDQGWYEWGDDWADDSYQVTVVTSHHLPSGYGAKDGRVVTACNGYVLDDDAWDRPRFPYAFLHWSPPMRGLFGSGLIEDLSGVQAKINDVSRDIQEALYYAAQLTIFVPRSSNINKEHLRGRHPKVVEFDGAAPQYTAPLPVSPQLFQYLDWLLNICDDLSGLSRDFQSGNTQLGAGASGKAQMVLDDIQSDRFAMFQLHDSLHMVDVGALMIDEARAIASDMSVPASEKAPWIREHKWKKIDLDEGLYHLKLEPKNFLPDTRAGRMQAVDAAGQAGLIKDPTDMLELMEEPDLQRVNRRLLGPKRAIARLMEDLVDLDVPLYELAPEAFFPTEDAIAEARAELNDAWATDAPEIILQRFRDWIRVAEYTLDQNAQSMPAMGPAGPGPGMAAGGPMASSTVPPGQPPGSLPPGAEAPPMATPLPGMAM